MYLFVNDVVLKSIFLQSTNKCISKSRRLEMQLLSYQSVYINNVDNI